MEAKKHRVDEFGQEEPTDAEASSWPLGARLLASAAILFQVCAVISAGLGQLQGGSNLLRRISDAFGPYYQLTYQGWGYGYYAPNPAPTPVATAKLVYEDGHEETVRLPTPGLWPRLRFQRQLAMANQLASDVEVHFGDASAHDSEWARSFAKHICRTKKCKNVEIYVQTHLFPDPERIVKSRTSGRLKFDLDNESFRSPRIAVGTYDCSDRLEPESTIEPDAH